jgi:hypothetical protein
MATKILTPAERKDHIVLAIAEKGGVMNFADFVDLTDKLGYNGHYSGFFRQHGTLAWTRAQHVKLSINGRQRVKELKAQR